jgi:hypothetical protein
VQAKLGSQGIGCSLVHGGLDNSFATNKHPSCRKHRLINHCLYTLERIDKNNLERCLFPAKIGNRHLIEHYKLVSDTNWLASASCKTLKSSRLGTVTRFDPKACDIIPHSPNPTFTVTQSQPSRGAILPSVPTPLAISSSCPISRSSDTISLPGLALDLKHG